MSLAGYIASLEARKSAIARTERKLARAYSGMPDDLVEPPTIDEILHINDNPEKAPEYKKRIWNFFGHYLLLKRRGIFIPSSTEDIRRWRDGRIQLMEAMLKCDSEKALKALDWLKGKE